jgi:hypothetical protein
MVLQGLEQLDERSQQLTDDLAGFLRRWLPAPLPSTPTRHTLDAAAVRVTGRPIILVAAAQPPAAPSEIPLKR